MFEIVWNWLLNVFKYKSHGKHVFADFIWNVELDNIDDVLLSKTVFKIIQTK